MGSRNAASPGTEMTNDSARNGSVTLSGVTKRFGAVTVLHGVDLEIEDGEFVTIVGPSGCGKSTLMRIIAGLERQDAGSVGIGDRLVDDLRPRDRDVAMVFQSYALYPHLSVFDNMALPLRMRRLGKLERLPLLGRALPGVGQREREIAESVREVARILQIEPLLERKPGQLSGGQKQRVAVGRAMVRRPRVFLMDEPLSNLDAELRVHMRAEIAQLHRRLGVTFIYVTHDQAEAMTMSDRVVVMMGGRLLQVDPPGRIYADPADLQVAGFVGSPRINLLPGEVISRDAVDVLGQRVAIDGLPEPGTKLQVGIRPPSVVVGAEGTSGLRGEVVYRENLGSDLFVHVELSEGRARVVARCDPDRAEALPIGATVSVQLPADKVLLFGESGRRVRAGRAVDSGHGAAALRGVAG